MLPAAQRLTLKDFPYVVAQTANETACHSIGGKQHFLTVFWSENFKHRIAMLRKRCVGPDSSPLTGGILLPSLTCALGGVPESSKLFFLPENHSHLHLNSNLNHPPPPTKKRKENNKLLDWNEFTQLAPATVPFKLVTGAVFVRFTLETLTYITKAHWATIICN